MLGKLCFPLICGSGGSKNRLAKAAGPEPCGPVARGDMKNCMPLQRKACQNVQNARCSDHF